MRHTRIWCDRTGQPPAWRYQAAACKGKKIKCGAQSIAQPAERAQTHHMWARASGEDHTCIAVQESEEVHDRLGVPIPLHLARPLANHTPRPPVSMLPDSMNSTL